MSIAGTIQLQFLEDRKVGSERLAPCRGVPLWWVASVLTMLALAPSLSGCSGGETLKADTLRCGPGTEQVGDWCLVATSEGIDEASDAGVNDEDDATSRDDAAPEDVTTEINQDALLVTCVPPHTGLSPTPGFCNGDVAVTCASQGVLESQACVAAEQCITYTIYDYDGDGLLKRKYLWAGCVPRV